MCRYLISIVATDLEEENERTFGTRQAVSEEKAKEEKKGNTRGL